MGSPEAVAGAGSNPEGLLQEFEKLDLSPYEARVLVALLRLGSANTAHLARQSGVPRTSTYQVLEELDRKGLAFRLPTQGPAVWASPGPEAVLDRLDAAQEERLRRQRACTAQLRETLARALPEPSPGASPHLQVVQGVAGVCSAYERILGEAAREVLVLSVPPYPCPSERVVAAVLGALGRGVRIRVVYQRSYWEVAPGEPFRRTTNAYHDAGVEARVAEEVPLKLVVADRRRALVAMSDPVPAEAGFPATLVVSHPGFAALQAEAFERLWQTAHPLEERPAAGRPTGLPTVGARASSRG